MVRGLLLLSAAVIAHAIPFQTSATLKTFASKQFSCINEAGDDVDWFAALKENNAFGYYYAEEDDTSLKRSTHSLDGKSGSILDTIQQLYGSLGSSYAYVVYNDETDEEKKSGTLAHAKGVLVFGPDQGFWLIHSVPRFPNRRSKGEATMPSDTYGQSFVCVTLGIKELNDIGNQLSIMGPQVYDWDITDDMIEAAPDFADWLVNNTQSTKLVDTVSLTTVGRRTFQHYASSKEWGKEIYEDLIASSLKTAIRAETWMNGAIANQIPSFCTPKYDYDVRDIRNVTMNDGASWLETQDHSKWAITDSATAHTVCIGDKNRQYSQSGRGGGSLCYKKKDLWTAFDRIVAEVDQC